MLDFYFDPILGLQYTFCENFIKPILAIDMDHIPPISVEEVIKLYQKQGILFTNSRVIEFEGLIFSNF